MASEKRTSALVDQWGNPISSKAPKSTPLPFPQDADDWGTFGNLKPSTIAGALDSACQGNNQSQGLLFRGMLEGWPHLRAEWGKRKRAVSMTPWKVLEDTESENPALQKKNAELCRHQMRLLKSRQLLSDLMDAVGYGVSMLELQWENTDKGQFVTAFQQVPFESLQTNWSTDLWEIYNGDTGLYDPMVACRHMMMAGGGMSGHPLRGGLFRALVWWYLLSKVNLTELKVFLEIYGVPVRFAVGDTSDKTAVSQMEAALKKLGFDAYAVFDKEWQIEVKGAPAASSHQLFADINAMANAEASKIIVGQTLTAEQGQVGSRALGSVHYDVSQDIKQSDCMDLADEIQESIFWPVIYYNGGKDAVAELPILHFYSDPPADLVSLAGWLKNLLDGGVQGIPTAWVFEQFGIPQAQDGEATVVPLQMQTKSIQPVSPGIEQPALMAGKVASDAGAFVAPPIDPFEKIVRALAQGEAGSSFQREVEKIKNVLGKQVRAGASITEAQRALGSYVSDHDGDPKFAEIMYKVLGVSKALGYYDAKFRTAQEIGRLK